MKWLWATCTVMEGKCSNMATQTAICAVTPEDAASFILDQLKIASGQTANIQPSNSDHQQQRPPAPATTSNIDHQHQRANSVGFTLPYITTRHTHADARLPKLLANSWTLCLPNVCCLCVAISICQSEMHLDRGYAMEAACSNAEA